MANVSLSVLTSTYVVLKRIQLPLWHMTDTTGGGTTSIDLPLHFRTAVARGRIHQQGRPSVSSRRVRKNGRCPQTSRIASFRSENRCPSALQVERHLRSVVRMPYWLCCPIPISAALYMSLRAYEVLLRRASSEITETFDAMHSERLQLTSTNLAARRLRWGGSASRHRMRIFSENSPHQPQALSPSCALRVSPRACANASSLHQTGSKSSEGWKKRPGGGKRRRLASADKKMEVGRRRRGVVQLRQI
ncbi:hypothetical protein IE81DRAFT_230400 [Ceraceosorus guamensis]|uniref:Uncharacterized protein n=1 Tax=Ceraceosorus guamensis TaxID=1522189 RepID=A0A316W5A3_9BASI|nr:hypothetical protein IE81DRAFT_230400 [Ceraceosorus guamensis]PWN45126.1 hypothetical protein IE81DRAFT_230400 [Ceraceosorus guamensis]